jgi:hypothetical protein
MRAGAAARCVASPRARQHLGGAEAEPHVLGHRSEDLRRSRANTARTPTTRGEITTAIIAATLDGWGAAIGAPTSSASRAEGSAEWSRSPCEYPEYPSCEYPEYPSCEYPEYSGHPRTSSASRAEGSAEWSRSPCEYPEYPSCEYPEYSGHPRTSSASRAEGSAEWSRSQCSVSAKCSARRLSRSDDLHEYSEYPIAPCSTLAPSSTQVRRPARLLAQPTTERGRHAARAAAGRR